MNTHFEFVALQIVLHCQLNAIKQNIKLKWQIAKGKTETQDGEKNSTKI